MLRGESACQRELALHPLLDALVTHERERALRQPTIKAQ
jgi:hypothetical protein